MVHCQQEVKISEFVFFLVFFFLLSFSFSFPFFPFPFLFILPSPPFLSAPYHSGAKPLEETRLEDIYKYLDTRKTEHDPFQLASEMDDRERGVLEETTYQIAQDMTIYPSEFADAYTSNCKFQQVNFYLTWDILQKKILIIIFLLSHSIINFSSFLRGDF